MTFFPFNLFFVFRLFIRYIVAFGLIENHNGLLPGLGYKVPANFLIYLADKFFLMKEKSCYFLVQLHLRIGTVHYGILSH
jgi:hypothetical protein